MKHSRFESFSRGARRSLLSAGIAAALAIALGSCASLPAYDPALPQISIARASEADIRQYGKNATENPYMEPKTLLRGKTDEFFILKLDFNLPAEAEITILAQAEAPAGKRAAKAYLAQDFKDFWDSRTLKDNDKDSLNQRRYTSIDRSCLGSFDFRQRTGRSSAFLPFASDNPMPKPMRFRVEVISSIGPGALYEFTLE